MPLKDGNGQDIEGVEVVLMVRHDHLASAADDKINLVIQVAVRSRTFTGRNLRHHHTQRLAVKANARVDHISQVAHGGGFENQIFLLDQHLTFAPQLLFVHGEGQLFGIHLRGARGLHVAVIDLPAAAGNKGLSGVLAFLRVDPEFGIALVFIDRLPEG